MWTEIKNEVIEGVDTGLNVPPYQIVMVTDGARVAFAKYSNETWMEADDDGAYWGLRWTPTHFATKDAIAKYFNGKIK